MSEKKKTYRNTAIIAITSFVNIFFSIIKHKVLAVYLGAAGIGRFGILNDTLTFTSSIALLGLNNSGVQAISEANSKNNHEVIKVYNSLNRFFLIVCFGVVVIFFVLAPYISIYLVGEDYLNWPLRIVIFSLFFKVKSQIQNVLIIGLQKIKLLAKANIYNGGIVTALSIPVAIIFGLESIPVLVLIIPFVAWTISFTQVRKVLKNLPRHNELLENKQLRPIIFLGVATLYGGLIQIVVKIIMKGGILKTFDEATLGYYQVAMGITGTYIAFLTSSIANDYYPRLVAKISSGTKEVTKFVNEQIGISMYLIMPVLLILLTFADSVIVLLFSKEFLPSSSLISFSIGGTLLKVITWPIAYVFLANRSTKTYMLTEFIGNGSHLILVFVALSLNNFEYLGVAYVLHYLIYLFFISFVFIKYYEGFFRLKNVFLFILNACTILCIVLSKLFLSFELALTINLSIIAIAFYISRKEYGLILSSVTKKFNG